MTEDNLAIAQKVILCAGLLIGALLFLFPHWMVSFYSGAGVPAFERDLGRDFIVSPPTQFTFTYANIYAKVVARINYARQFTEVAIALLLMFGLLRGLKLKKPAGD
jgi:Na+-driven multidrug efflux pump